MSYASLGYLWDTCTVPGQTTNTFSPGCSAPLIATDLGVQAAFNKLERTNAYLTSVDAEYGAARANDAIDDPTYAGWASFYANWQAYFTLQENSGLTAYEAIAASERADADYARGRDYEVALQNVAPSHVKQPVPPKPPPPASGCSSSRLDPPRRRAGPRRGLPPTRRGCGLPWSDLPGAAALAEAERRRATAPPEH